MTKARNHGRHPGGRPPLEQGREACHPNFTIPISVALRFREVVPANQRSATVVNLVRSWLDDPRPLGECPQELTLRMNFTFPESQLARLQEATKSQQSASAIVSRLLARYLTEQKKEKQQ